MGNLNRFVLKISLFVVPQILVATALAAYFAFNSYAVLPFEQVYRHQVEKVSQSGDYNTVFIGDSSLGNSIDASYFSEVTGLRAMNLALVGTYGYAGSYNMLKRFHAKNPTLKIVFIIHTLDMSRRELSHQGYLYSVSSQSDFDELEFNNKMELIGSAYNITGQAKEYVKCLFRGERNYIENDYLVQKKKVDHPTEVMKFSVDEIAEDKYFYLEKIALYAKENHLQVLYLHGPCYEKLIDRSQEYIETVNQNILRTGLNVVTQTTPIPNSDLGDADDHVAPAMKEIYTQKYIDLIQENVGL